MKLNIILKNTNRGKLKMLSIKSVRFPRKYLRNGMKLHAAEVVLFM